jgi:hypothetical protein
LAPEKAKPAASVRAATSRGRRAIGTSPRG